MKTKYALLTALFASITSSAHAIPLLGENAAQNVSAALTLYPDSVDGNLFYYMPNSSALQMDTNSSRPVPMFGFTYWGLNPGSPIEAAGAYLTFTAHLVSDKNQKDALNAFIASGKRVAALPILSSTIGLTSSNSTEPPLKALFSELDFATSAGMAEDDIGVNAIMTGLGAKVFKSAIDGAHLFKTDYCFKVQGLGPNFNATIDVDYTRVYDDFQTHLSGGGWFTSYSIDAEVEKLRENRAVNIVINGGDAKLEEYVQNVADDIVAKLFTPSLSATPTSGGGSSGFWSFSSYSLKATVRDELKHEFWTLTKRDLVTHEFCLPITLSDLHPYYNDVVRNADGTTP